MAPKPTSRWPASRSSDCWVAPPRRPRISATAIPLAPSTPIVTKDVSQVRAVHPETLRDEPGIVAVYQVKNSRMKMAPADAARAHASGAIETFDPEVSRSVAALEVAIGGLVAASGGAIARPHCSQNFEPVGLAEPHHVQALMTVPLRRPERFGGRMRPLPLFLRRSAD